MNMLVLGVGTGRCGTHSLSKLLSLQKSTKSTHERYGPKVRWNAPSNLWPYRLWEDTKRPEEKIVCDIAFYWTAHIETFLEWADKENRELRIIAMKRDKKKVVDSYDVAKAEGVDHWSFHGYQDEVVDHKWDLGYPCYETDNRREGCALFWEEVYNIIESFEDDRIKTFRTNDLNTEEGVRAILGHIGYEEPNIKTEIRLAESSE